MKIINMLLSILVLTIGFHSTVFAGNDKHQGLPPGLQKKVEKGQHLPPGWQKKIAVGETLDEDVYRQGKVVSRDEDGSVTIRVEDEIFKIIENTREISEILDL